MSLRAMLGIWHDRVSVGISEFDREALELELGATRFQMVIGNDRRLYLYASGEAGNLFTGQGEAQQPGNEVNLTCTREAGQIETSRCCNHWVIMLPGEFLGHQAYCLDLPLDHQLPWPKLRDCDSYWVPAEVMKEIVRRRRSALDAKHPVPTPPASFTKRLTAQQRTDLWRADNEVRHINKRSAA